MGPRVASNPDLDSQSSIWGAARHAACSRGLPVSFVRIQLFSTHSTGGKTKTRGACNLPKATALANGDTRTRIQKSKTSRVPSLNLCPGTVFGGESR